MGKRTNTSKLGDKVEALEPSIDNSNTSPKMSSDNPSEPSQRERAAQVMDMDCQLYMVDDEWYVNKYVRRAVWRKEYIIDGLDLTIDEYHAANSRLMALLEADNQCRVKASLQERIIKFAPVYEKFWEEHHFMYKNKTSYGVTIPRWWKEQCLTGWIGMVEDDILQRRKSLAEAAIEAIKQAEQDSLPPTKRVRQTVTIDAMRGCHLRITRSTTGEQTFINLSDFENTTASPGEDPSMKLSAVEDMLVEKLGYDKKAEKVILKDPFGIQKDIKLNTEAKFRKAVLSIRKNGKSVVDLFVDKTQG